MSTSMSVQEFAYDEVLQITGETNFGISMQAALSGAEPIPPEGVRFDIPFEGEITGPKLQGQIAGTDYVFMRGDGVPMVHVHAVITTPDGGRIALFAEGPGIMTPGTPIVELRENVSLYSAAPDYAWVNRSQFWATGQVNLTTGKVTLKGYVA